MLGKVFASAILIAVLYIFWVFFAPNLTDDIAKKMGILHMNSVIRQFKQWADVTSDTLLQIKDASWAIGGVRGIVKQANETINQTSEAINSIRQAWEQKIEQVQKTADSIQRASEAISEVQNNVSALTSFSGASYISWSLSVTGAQR